MRFTELFGPATERVQPDLSNPMIKSASYKRLQRLLSGCIGAICLLLPIVLWRAAGGWAEPRPGHCFPDSISHFVHQPGWGGLLVLSLGVMAGLLVAYRGENRIEFWAATCAGAAALGVALFPVSGHGCGDLAFRARLMAPWPDGPVPDESVAFALFAGVDRLHFAAAALLLGILALFCLVIFTRRVPSRHGPKGTPLPRVKRIRNALYLLCGAVIVLLLGALGWRATYGAKVAWWADHNLTFWAETAALWSFGLAWSVKGRLFGTALMDR